MKHELGKTTLVLISALAAVFICALLFVGCATAKPAFEPKDEYDKVTQISVFDALAAGVYDAQIQLSEVQKYGDLGLGTFESLDGEMILSGEFYQVKDDGTVLTPDLSVKTPFATVVHFKNDIDFIIDKSLSFSELCNEIDKRILNQNLITAIRITGDFTYMKVRSIPKQMKPYKPLVEVARSQPEFEYQNISGELVGFKMPLYMQSINVPGYHLHFLSSDKKSGGHVLGLEVDTIKVELDEINRFEVILPDEIKHFSKIDFSSDRSKEIEEAES
jgi:acetolactate decarboxylase